MSYIIQRNDGIYLTLDNNKRISYTTNKNQAYINDKEKIENFFNNCLPANQKDKHKIIELEEPTEIKIINPTECDISDAIDNILRFSKEDFDNYKAKLVKQLSDIDNEQQDILHYIEFTSLDIFKGYKAYKMLHDCRKRRREIKDKLYEFDTFKNLSWEDIKEYKNISFINNFDSRSYTPRILKELFEVK